MPYEPPEDRNAEVYFCISYLKPLAVSWVLFSVGDFLPNEFIEDTRDKYRTQFNFEESRVFWQMVTTGWKGKPGHRYRLSVYEGDKRITMSTHVVY